MEFKDREKELEFLKGLKGPVRLAVIGRRRIGKTTLVEHHFKDAITLFVPAEKTEREIIEGWASEHKGRTYLPPVGTLRELFEYLFEKERGKIIFIDELQNVLKVNGSFIYDLQRLMDRYKDANVVVSGSYISIMKELIEEYKSPLYGRFDFTIKLRELDPITVLGICRELGYGREDAVRLYSVFGGVPKYYEALERLGCPPFRKAVESLFVTYPRPLGEEIRTMLREEFGKEHKMFFSVLSAISAGKNTLGAISEHAGKKQTAMTKYVGLLKDDFEMITREIPATEKKAKKGGYRITSNVFQFWLRFIWKNYGMLEANEDAALAKKVAEELESHVGERFEAAVKECFTSGAFELPFTPERMGRQWGKLPQKPPEANQYEIDLVGLNEKTSEIFFCECKWSDIGTKEAEKILAALKEKAGAVQWKLGARKEHFGIAARNIRDKETLRKEGFLAFDLSDISY